MNRLLVYRSLKYCKSDASGHALIPSSEASIWGFVYNIPHPLNCVVSFPYNDDTDDVLSPVN